MSHFSNVSHVWYFVTFISTYHRPHVPLLLRYRVDVFFPCFTIFSAVDFFNEVSLLYGIVADGAAQYERPGAGFPPGFEYLWVPEGAKGKGRKP